MEGNKAKNTSIGTKECGYKLEFTQDGIFLTVYPHQDDTVLFGLTDITKILDEKGIKSCPMDLIAKAIRSGDGAPVKISDEAVAEEECTQEPERAAISENVDLKEPSITVSVSKDRMEAVLSIDATGNCSSPTYEMAMEKIWEKNVAFGIDEQAVHQAVESPKCEVVVARGKPPVNGKDAKIRKLVALDDKGRPVELETGRVDFKDLNLFTIVREGDVLAERIPHTLGIPGMDVFGKTIAAKPGKPVMLPVGKNTKIIEENKLVSLIDGQLVVNGNKMSVVPTIEIHGDVGMATGNISFMGTVIVRGSVQPGFEIKAGGDVEVYGSISGGTIEARNVTVKAGIQGMQRGHIKVEEDIKSSFAENATLIAGRDVIITESILHSNVSAGKRIVVQGRRGVIAGGVAVAGEEILVKSAGNLMDTSTRLEVGINPMLKEEYKRTRQELAKAELTLDQALKSLKILKSIAPDRLTEAKREMLLKLTKAQFPLAAEVKKHKDRLAEIEAAFEELKAGRIKVTDKAYPGVKIIVGSVMKNIRTVVQHSKFYEENDEIKIGPL